MAKHPPKHVHNLLAFGVDYLFFASALGFMNLNTVLPALAIRLGGSKMLVGVLITVISLAWNIPQILAGNLAARHERKKPLIIRMMYLGRPLVLLMAALLALTAGQPGWLNLVVLFISLSIFFATDAFAAVGWLDILGRAFPSDKRGGYISLWQAGKGLGMLGVAAAVGYFLGEEGPAFPYNYALLLAGAGICLALSAIGTALIYEPPPAGGEQMTTYVRWRDLGPYLAHLWQEDKSLQRIIVARVLYTLSTMSFPFYIIYATQELRFPEQTIGLFIFAQTVGALLASLVLGQIANRWGTRRAIQVGTLAVVSAPLLALSIALFDSFPRQTYFWVYICIGLSDNLVVLGYINYVLDIAPPARRTIYTGVSNALNSFGVLGTTIAGWLLAQTSYSILFATSLMLGIGVLWVVLGLPAAPSTFIEVPSRPGLGASE